MDSNTQSPPPVAHLERKAQLLLLLMVLLLFSAGAYVMVARGAFERTQQVVLVADDSEGVVVGMDLTFSGFPIGRVGRIELAPDGNARILVDVPRKDAHWLRTSSVFTMESGLVGGTRIRAFSGVLTDPLLPDGAERRVLRGDAKAEIPLMVASVRELVSNLSSLTGPEAPLNTSLRNVQSATERLNGPTGALGLMLGNDTEAKKIIVKADGIALKTDLLITNADRQVFGPAGVMGDAQATVVQLNGLLADARNSLKKVDSVLLEAQAIGANTREATTDLAALRGEVESSLRKVEHLVNEVNRKWPFARDTELKLP
jgi:phospholipid/cholesterol/gamma-HCH transport system substrate-binding protein